MAVEHIDENDTLNAGRVKINAAIDQSNDAIEKATNAETNANQALTVANSTQTQLDNIILENGQSDAEVVQARTKADGTTFPLLKDRLNDTDSKIEILSEQLEEAEQQVLKTEATIRRARKSKQPLVTFIDDDGAGAVLTTIMPLAKSKGIPYCLAVYATSILVQNYPETLKDLQDNYGWEILSHSYNHVRLSTLTDEQIHQEYSQINNLLRGLGLKVDSIAYPFGDTDKRVRAIAADYYRSGFAADIMTKTGQINPYPLNTYFIDRVSFNTLPTGVTDKLAYFKSKVDEAVTNKTWCVFMTHCYDENHDNQVLSDLIDYIQSLNVDIVTVNEALDRIGNIVDVGDMLYDNYLQIDCEGIIYGRSALMREIDSTGFTNATPIDAYPDHCISVVPSRWMDNGGFPEGAGVLITSRLGNDTNFSYQEFRPISSDRIYKRWWDKANGVWKEWRKVSDVSFEFTANKFTASSPLSAFSDGVTHFWVQSSQASGLPDNIGGLITVYKYSDSAWNKQEYRRYGSNDIWARYWDGSNWTAWEKLNSSMFLTDFNIYSASNVPRDFPHGITTFAVNQLGSTGTPNNYSGIITTYKLAKQDLWTRQEFRRYASNEIYSRYWDGTNWTPWVKISAV